MRQYNPQDELDKQRRMQTRQAWGSPAFRTPNGHLPSLTSSGSLPQLVPSAGMTSDKVQHSPPLFKSPTPHDVSAIEESMMLRKKVKEMEAILKRTTAVLAKERKEFAAAKAQEEQRRALELQGRERWKTEVETQLRRVRSETEKRLMDTQSDSRSRLDETQAAMAALEEQAKKQAEKEKEERVELLRRQVARRMMNAGITKGWTAWHAKWHAKQTKKRLLQKAAGRLARPAVSKAFSNWHTSWQDAEKNRMVAEMRSEMRALGGSAESVREEMEQMRVVYERRLALAEEAKAGLMSKLTELDGGAEAARQQMMEELAKENEKRVEHLCQMIARRMMKKELVRGWTGWHEMWDEERRRKRQLAHAAGMLKNPELTQCWRDWKEMWSEARAEIARQLQKDKEKALMREKALLEGGSAALNEELENMRKEYERRLQISEHRYNQAMEKLSELDGGFAAEQLRHEKELEAENEKRVEHLCQMIAKRMMKKELVRGWAGWHDMWEEGRRQKRMLAHAAHTIKNPALPISFRLWLEDWKETQQEAEKMRKEEIKRIQRERERDLVGNAADIQAELDNLRIESRKQLQAAESKLRSAMEKLEKLDGGAAEAERKLQEQLAQEEKDKEQRVEHLSLMIAKRMLKKELVRGWTAWFGAYEEQAHIKRMLRKATAQMQSPGLANAYNQWKELWVTTKANLADRARKNRELSYSQREKELVAERDAVQEELDRSTATYESKLKAAESRQKQLLEKLNALDGGAAEAEMRVQELVDKEAREKEARVEHLCQMLARRLMKQDVARGFTAWMDMYDEACRLKCNMAHATGMLKNPYFTQSWRDWKFLWTNTKARLGERAEQQRAKMMNDRFAQVTGDAKGLKDELERQQADFNKKLVEKNRQIRELQKAMEEKLGQNSGAETSKADRLTREKALMEQQLVEANGASAAAKAQLYAQIEKENAENEKRMEHLSGMMARRMLNKDLASGFSAWFEMWDAKRMRKRQLAHAASRLKNPELAEAFHMFVAEWQEAKQAKAERAQRMKEAQLSGGVVAAQAEMNRISQEYERKLQAAEEKQRELLERLSKVDGGAAAAEMRLQKTQADLEKENEKRIEHLSQMIASRMLKKELTRGWVGWFSQWEDERRRKRQLAFAASKLKNPELSEAFHIWSDLASAGREAKEKKMRQARAREKERQLLGGTADVQQQLEAVQKECEMKLKLAAVDYERLMARLAAVDGKEAAAERALQEQLAQEAKDKEKRVEHLSLMMAKRMINKDIVRGWTAWQSMWEEEARQKRLLKAAGQRLLKPAMSAAFGNWKLDWDEEERAKLQAAARQRELELGRSRDDLENELTRLKKEMEAKLKAAEVEKHRALEAQLAEIMGDKDHEKEAEDAAMKEQRVEELFARMARRMINSDIIRGFTSWVDMWETQKHMMRCMNKAGSRLTKPKMAGGFQDWVWVWSEEKRAAQRKRAAEKRAALAEELRVAKLETGKLSMITVARDDELHALRQKVVMMGDDLTGKKAALMTAEEERAQWIKLQENHRDTIRVLEGIEKERDEAIQNFAQEQAQSKALLKKLLEDQRTKTDDELARGRKDVREATTKLKEAKERNAELKKEITELMKKLPKKKEPPPVAGSKITLSGDPSVSLSDQLAEALKKNSTRVLDLFRGWDTDGDGEVSRAEFHKAMPALGLDLPKGDIEELFSAWDTDGGGKLAYKELKKILAGGAVPAKKKILLIGDGTPMEQLAVSLKQNSGRVLDLFRSWDADGDGEVSRKEFQKAIPALGYTEVPKDVIDELFDSWDVDGGGSLAYKELKKLLAGQPSPGLGKLKPTSKLGKAAVATGKLNSAVSALSMMKPS